jgi:D-aminopeptidase
MARLFRRAQNGLARTGSSSSDYSGEIVICFTTSGRIQHADDSYARQTAVLSGESPVLDPLFQAVTEGTEEAVLNSHFNAETVVGHNDARHDRFPNERLPDLMDRPLGP